MLYTPSTLIQWVANKTSAAFLDQRLGHRASVLIQKGSRVLFSYNQRFDSWNL